METKGMGKNDADAAMSLEGDDMLMDDGGGMSAANGANSGAMNGDGVMNSGGMVGGSAGGTASGGGMSGNVGGTMGGGGMSGDDVGGMAASSAGGGKLKKCGGAKLAIGAAITAVVAAVVAVVAVVVIDHNATKTVEEMPAAQTDNGSTTEKGKTELDFAFIELEDKQENLIYSPLSIRYALAMLDEGASGETKEQIERVLGGAELPKYKDVPEVLSLANAIFIRDSFEGAVNEEFPKTLASKYGAEVELDPFKNANAINAWAKEKTLGQIPEVIGDEVVKEMQMALVNALAIDMRWEQTFDESHDRAFKLEDGSEMTTSMMNMNTSSENVAYYADDEVTAAELDLQEYEGQQLQFLAVMPKDGLTEYAKEFNAEKLEKITEELTPATEPAAGVHLLMPRFSFDYSLDLQGDLEALGVTDAFSADRAEFPLISSERLFVDVAVHKANIDVSEKGVKAAAVTLFGMDVAMAAPQDEAPVEIRIDQPFLFVIRDKNSGEIWFVGTVYEPEEWGSD